MHVCRNINNFRGVGASDSPKDVPDNDTIVNETHTLSEIVDSEVLH